MNGMNGWMTMMKERSEKFARKKRGARKKRVKSKETYLKLMSSSSNDSGAVMTVELAHPIERMIMVVSVHFYYTF